MIVNFKKLQAALLTHPSSGLPYNRLAHWALKVRENALSVVFYFSRALSSEPAVETARESLADFFDKVGRLRMGVLGHKHA